MEGFITSLTSSGSGNTVINAVNLWNTVGDVAPLVIILCLFALARRVINKNLRAAGKGSAGKI